MTRDLGAYAHILDTRHTWHGPAHVGPGGVFALTCDSRNDASWTVHRIDPKTKVTRPVLPFPSFEAASRAAASYARG